MTIRHYFVLAVERPYNPLTGDDITYHVELDTSLRRSVRQGGGKHLCGPVVQELTVRVLYTEDSWGPDTVRIEGFTRNPRTQKANRVIGHHKTHYKPGTNRIGVLQVSEDD